MPNQVDFQIPRTTDKLLVTRVRAVMKDVAFSSPSVEMHASYGDRLNFPLDKLENNGQAKVIFESDGVLTKWVTFQFETGIVVRVSRHSEWVDNVSVEPGNLNSEQFAKALLLLKAELREMLPSRHVASVLGSELDAFYKSREQHLAKQEDQVAAFFLRMQDFSLALTQEVEKHKANLDADLQKNKERLDAEHEERTKKLDERQAELEKLRAEVDDRESRSVRRSIHKELKAKLDQRNTKFELTEGTVRMRRTIFWTSIALMVLFGGTAAALLYRDFTSIADHPNPYLVVREIMFSVAFGLTAVFFIRWNQQWFRMHADEEFKLKKLDLDIDRASWLVETSLEWKAEKGGQEIPKELLDKLSGDLFNAPKPDTTDLHPAEMLASAIFGAASGVTVKTPEGTSVTLDRKGIRQLQQAGKE